MCILKTFSVSVIILDRTSKTGVMDVSWHSIRERIGTCGRRIVSWNVLPVLIIYTKPMIKLCIFACVDVFHIESTTNSNLTRAEVQRAHILESASALRSNGMRPFWETYASLAAMSAIGGVL